MEMQQALVIWQEWMNKEMEKVRRTCIRMDEYLDAGKPVFYAPLGQGFMDPDYMLIAEQYHGLFTVVPSDPEILTDGTSQIGLLVALLKARGISAVETCGSSADGILACELGLKGARINYQRNSDISATMG
jgi:hypothetical protein